MKYKAIFFDMFETLITEWGHEKYTKGQMCSDLGIERETFDEYWEEKGSDRYLGGITFEDCILYVCEKCGIDISPSTLAQITEKRMRTKSACFDYVNPSVYQLLNDMRQAGIKLVIISNCSSEEVTVIKQSKLYEYFDHVILSYEVKMEKPDVRIYNLACELLGVTSSESIFIGDGGSNELEGARSVGLKAIQAKWYTNEFPNKRESKESFLIAEKPEDVWQYIN